MVLGSWGDDGSVGNNDDSLLVLALEVVDNLVTDLLESSERSVWNSHEEVLGSGAISLGVGDGLDTVDEHNVQVGSLGFVFGLKLTKCLSNFLFEVSWLLSGFLDYFISSIEHV